MHLDRTIAELEGQLAEATTRYAVAERDELQRGLDPTEEVRSNSPLLPVVILSSLLGAAWLDGDFQLPRWLIGSACLLATGWLLRDGWRFGRARARITRA